MSIRIYTDSGADLEPQEFTKYNIGMISLSIQMDGVIYRADESFSKDEFFRLLAEAKEFPTTSQPSPADFEEVFEAARQNGDQVIYITLSSALSGTCQGARAVKHMGEYDNVYIIDSLSATLGQKLLVMNAAWLRDRGFGAEEIVQRVEKLRSRIRIYAGVDTLEYLYKGGRLSKAAAGIGTMAQLKPVITVTTKGTVHVAGKALGKGKAVKQVMALFEKDPPDLRFPLYGVYSGDQENFRELQKKLLKEETEIKDENIFSIGPVIGAHIGPGAYGLVYVAKNQK